jgi:HAD superfamily phosphoserine phosphatase-like hydrolase
LSKGLVLDFDGTLIEYENSWDVIREHFGLPRGLYRKMVLEEKMSEAQFRALELLEWRRRSISKAKLRQLFRCLPIKPGVRTLLEGAKERGYKIAIVSQAPDFVLSIFYEKTGFRPDFEASYQFQFDDEGLIKEVRFPYRDKKGFPSKVLAAKAFQRSIGAESEEIVAVGDHYNDIELLKWAGLAIAVGPHDPSLLEVADKVVTEDLSEILQYL